MLMRAAKLGELAAEFDGVHDVRRAQAVGSVDRIIAPRGSPALHCRCARPVRAGG